MILDLAGDEDDPFAQQARIDVEAAFPAAGLFDDDRDQGAGDGIGGELSLRTGGAEQIEHGGPHSVAGPMSRACRRCSRALTITFARVWRPSARDLPRKARHVARDRAAPASCGCLAAVPPRTA